MSDREYDFSPELERLADRCEGLERALDTEQQVRAEAEAEIERLRGLLEQIESVAEAASDGDIGCLEDLVGVAPKIRAALNPEQSHE